MVVHDRVTDTTEANFQESQDFKNSLKPGDGTLKNAETELEKEPVGYDRVTKEWTEEEAFAGVFGVDRYADGLHGMGKFVTDLSKLICLSAAAATSPVLAASMAGIVVEDVAPESGAQVSEHSPRRESPDLSYYSKDGKFVGATISSHNADSSGGRTGSCKTLTNERLLGMVDDLTLRLNQMTVNEPTKIEVKARRSFYRHGLKERLLLPDKIELLPQDPEDVEWRTLKTFPLHLAHPEIPESGLERYA